MVGIMVTLRVTTVAIIALVSTGCSKPVAIEPSISMPAFKGCAEEAYALEHSADEDRRLCAALRLETCSGDVAVGPLIRQLHVEPDDSTALFISLSLRTFPEAQQRLYADVHNPYPDIRERIADSLYKPDVDKTAALLSDPEPGVRIAYAFRLAGWRNDLLKARIPKEKDPEVLQYLRWESVRAKPWPARKRSIAEILKKERHQFPHNGG